MLVLESPEAPARAFVDRLRSEGYAIDVVPTLGQARIQRGDVDYDGLLLDRDAVDGDALALVVELRRAGDKVPIIMMSDRGRSPDRLEGLEAGVDDYMGKPVDVDELALRVRKVLIRATARPRKTPPPLDVVGRVGLARNLREAYVDGEQVTLSSTQFCLTDYLIAHRHREVTADEMLAHCWDAHLPSTSRPLPPQLTRVRAAFRGALRLELVRPRTYRVWIDGDDTALPGPEDEGEVGQE